MMKHTKFLNLAQIAIMSSLSMSMTMISQNANAHGSSHIHWDNWSTQSNYQESMSFSSQDDTPDYLKVNFYVLKIENQQVIEPKVIHLFNHNKHEVKGNIEFALNNTNDNINKIGKINIDNNGNVSLDKSTPVANGSYIFILKPASGLNSAANNYDNLGQSVKTQWGKKTFKGNNDQLMLTDVKLMSENDLNQEIKALKNQDAQDEKTFSNIIDKTKHIFEASVLAAIAYVGIKKVLNHKKANKLSMIRSKYLAQNENIDSEEEKNLKSKM